MSGSAPRKKFSYLRLTAFNRVFKAFLSKKRLRAEKTTCLASPRTGLRAARKSANCQRAYGVVGDVRHKRKSTYKYVNASFIAFSGNTAIP
jgi:hypothetical protein